MKKIDSWNNCENEKKGNMQKSTVHICTWEPRGNGWMDEWMNESLYIKKKMTSQTDKQTNKENEKKTKYDIS